MIDSEVLDTYNPLNVSAWRTRKTVESFIRAAPHEDIEELICINEDTGRYFRTEESNTRFTQELLFNRQLS